MCLTGRACRRLRRTTTLGDQSDTFHDLHVACANDQPQAVRVQALRASRGLTAYPAASERHDACSPEHAEGVCWRRCVH